MPEDERGEVYASVVIDKQKSAKQSGAFLKTMVLGVVGVVAGVLVLTVLKQPGGWALTIVFGLLTALSVFFFVAMRAQATAPGEHIAFQIRSGGVLVPQSFFIRWDEIVSANYEWTGPRGATAIGIGGALIQQPMTSMMAKHGLDGAARTINFILRDYKATNARSGGDHNGMLVNPMLGSPGFASVILSGTVDDELFQFLLEVTHRELAARGMNLVKKTHENQQIEDAAYAARKKA